MFVRPKKLQKTTSDEFSGRQKLITRASSSVNKRKISNDKQSDESEFDQEDDENDEEEDRSEEDSEFEINIEASESPEKIKTTKGKTSVIEKPHDPNARVTRSSARKSSNS
jgi:hypothetical protein